MKLIALKTNDGQLKENPSFYCRMLQIGLSRRPKRKPNGITKADREARKSDDL